MKNLKAVVPHLLFAFADATFQMLASKLPVCNSTIKFNLNLQHGCFSGKWPSGILKQLILPVCMLQRCK
jgi:hypothetical protein